MVKFKKFNFRAFIIIFLVAQVSACKAEDQMEGAGKNEAQTKKYEKYTECIIDRIQGAVTPTKWRISAETCNVYFPSEPLPDLWIFLFSETEARKVRGSLNTIGRNATLYLYNGNRTRGISHVEVKLTEKSEELFKISRSYRVPVEVGPLSAASAEFLLVWDEDNDFTWSFENVWGFVDYSAVELEDAIEERQEILDRIERIKNGEEE